MAQFVNTALSSLVANMYIPALYERLHDTFLGTLIFQVSLRFVLHFNQIAQPSWSLVATYKPLMGGEQYVNPSQHAAWQTLSTALPSLLKCW